MSQFKIQVRKSVMIINTNSAATIASKNLNVSTGMLQKSLARLSSGSKITSPADDAGGLAVSMRMEAALKRTEATSTNLSNAVSFLQTQDGALKTTGKVLERVAELKTLSSDVTKSASDIANYDTEFTALKAQLTSLTTDTFNSVALFGAGAGGTTLAVATSEDASQTMNITQSGAVTNVATITGAANLAALTTAVVTTAITATATSRAQNGAEASRLGFALDQLATNGTNLEAANSRIVDVDVAAESTKLARNNILVQAGTAMLAQANQSTQGALQLLR
jgi:flagellin